MMAGMRLWVRVMNEQTFQAGYIIDRFVWTYTLYMSAGYGETGVKSWISKAVVETEEWLKTAM